MKSILLLKKTCCNDDPLLSRREAANYLGVGERTLANWKCAKRYGLPVVKIGRLAKYRRSDLDLFIAEGANHE